MPATVQTTRIDAAIDAALRYIAARQCADGGFCAYRTDYLEESNLHDTYYAVKTCVVAGRPVPQAQRVLDYLGTGAHVTHRVAPMFFAVRSAELLGAPALQARYADLIATFNAGLLDQRARLSLSTWLRRVFMLVTLQGRAGHDALHRAVASIGEDLRQGGLGQPTNLIDTQMGLAILAATDQPIVFPAARDFVDRLQVPGIGFTNTAHSRHESTDVQRAGVLSCRLLGLRLRHADTIRKRVLAAQRATGGFARAPGAQGDFESHYHGLDLLTLLQRDGDGNFTP